VENGDNVLSAAWQKHKIATKIISQGPDTLCLEVVVWAKPGAKKEQVEVRSDGKILAYIHAPPVEGAANQAIISLLAKSLGLSASSFDLVSGHKGKEKRLRLNYSFTRHKGQDYYVTKIDQLFL